MSLAVLVSPSQCLDRVRFLELNKKGREQAQHQDWKGLHDTMVEIGKEMPGPTPTYLLRMASVETHLGHGTEALQWLQKYADMGLKYDMAADDDLKSLLSNPSTRDAAIRIEHEMQERTTPIQRAEAICILPMPDLMPEDLTFDAAAGTFVVSSIQHHTLYRAKLPKLPESECALQEIPRQNDAKRWPVLAVSADPKRHLLWMTANAMPGFTGFPKEDEGKAALFAIDGATGKTIRRFDLAASGPAVLGDMSVAQDGTVYVSDSEGGGVYRVRGDISAATLEKIGGDFFSPQTPVLAADGKRLFVADYSMGIGMIDLTSPQTSGQLNYLPHPESVAVTGLDGLYLSGDSLIGIQNGTQPERIMVFHLNTAQNAITSAEVIEQATDRLGDPTHVTQVNGWFYVTANVGWNKVNDQGQLKPGEHFTSPLLLRFRESPRRTVEPRNRPRPRRP